VSLIYRSTPAPVSEACEQLLRAYVDDAPLTCDPGMLHDPAALGFAEAVALQAVEQLRTDRGSTSDLLFAPLMDTGTFRDVAPAMPPLLRFLRARLANHTPVLRLDPETPSPAYTLLLIAAQALRAAQDEVPDAVSRCLAGLASDPTTERVPNGDLVVGLADADVENVLYFRDELRKTLTQTVPVRDTLLAPNGDAVLVLDLAARPDVQDLFRILITDPPPGGADTGSEWGVFAGPEETLLRLDVTWFDPVRVDLALVLDVDHHAPAVQRITTSTTLVLTHLDPDRLPDASLPLIPVPADADRVRELLLQAKARRTTE
jgi:hypothetical protein